jgi:hypothetical protein
MKKKKKILKPLKILKKKKPTTIISLLKCQKILRNKTQNTITQKNLVSVHVHVQVPNKKDAKTKEKRNLQEFYLLLLACEL